MKVIHFISLIQERPALLSMKNNDGSGSKFLRSLTLDFGFAINGFA